MAVRTSGKSGDGELAVVLRLANEEYGIDITSIQEIIRVPAITRVPHAAPYVLGVTNLRGRVIPIIDLRIRLGAAREAATLQSRVIIVNLEEGDVGFWVDGVSEVLPVDPGEVDPPGALVWLKEPDLLRGVVKLEGRLVGLINAERLLVDQAASKEAA